MQLAYRHDERSGESYEALDGKNIALNSWSEEEDFDTVREGQYGSR